MSVILINKFTSEKSQLTPLDDSKQNLHLKMADGSHTTTLLIVCLLNLIRKSYCTQLTTIAIWYHLINHRAICVLKQMGQHCPGGMTGFLQLTGAHGVCLHSISPWMQEHCWQSFSQVAPSSWTVPFALHDFWHSHSSTLLILPSAAAN